VTASEVHPWSLTANLWILPIVGIVVATLWLGLKVIETENVSARLSATFAGLILLALKVIFPLVYGPPEQSPMEKCKSLGADLTFASISFDISMYLGNVQLSKLGPLTVTNPGWFYFAAGLVTMLVWLLWLYPTTSGKSKPSNMAISLSMFFGIAFYFGRILIYVLKG
jgi:hypothetical protein